jgi:hypothetical protein
MLRFWAYRARREGKPIPRWQLHNARWTECRLTVAEEHGEAVGRTVKVARMASDRGSEVFPPLLDAQLIHADAGRLILNGIESVDSRLGERAQTWVLHTSDHRSNPTGAIRFWALKQRSEGRILAPEELIVPAWVEGQFTLQEERDNWLGRTVRVCRLTREGGGDSLEPLIEAQLVMANPDQLVLCGVERDPLTRCDRLQSWVLYPRDSSRGREASPAPKQERAEMLPP